MIKMNMNMNMRTAARNRKLKLLLYREVKAVDLAREELLASQLLGVQIPLALKMLISEWDV